MALLRALSLLAVVGVIGWQVHSGMYDLDAVTTADLLKNPRSWNGRDVLLTNVSIRKHSIHQGESDTIIWMQLVNGQTNPPDTEEAVWVVGKMPNDQANSVESLPWCLKNYELKRLSSARVAVVGDTIVLKQYGTLLNQSWFSTPYSFSVNVVNRFAPLHASVLAGVAVQVIVYIVIGLLVFQGLFFIVPEP